MKHRVSRFVPGVGRVEWICLPDDLLFGDSPGTTFDFPDWRVAGPEKALCDLLWLCEGRGRAVPLDSLRLEEINRERLDRYSRRMGLDLGGLNGL